MKASDLREKSVEELNQELDSLVKLAFSIQVKKMTGSSSTTNIRFVKKDIARVKTILTEKGRSV